MDIDWPVHRMTSRLRIHSASRWSLEKEWNFLRTSDILIRPKNELARFRSGKAGFFAAAPILFLSANGVGGLLSRDDAVPWP